MRYAVALGLVGSLGLSACDEEAKDEEEPVVCAQTASPACADAAILQLNLQTDPAPGAISNQAVGGEWHSAVDATAGGAFANPPDSFIYARFTPDGLVKMPIGDEAAFATGSWEIAFRRYIIRINSGDSGTSCITAARLPDGTSFDSVVAVPATTPFHSDDYFTESCDMQADGSGLGSPATALSGFWSYPGCVQMTGTVYVLALRDGRHLKLEVTQYYNDAAHSECQTAGAVTTTSSGAANIQLRWAYLD